MSRGFDVAKWTAWHDQRGESYRWFKAFRVEDPRSVAAAERDSRIYVEQAIDPSWKALVHDSEHEVMDEEGTLLPKGTAMISVMPARTLLARLDRIVLPERTMISRALVTRSEATTDALVFTPVAEIVTVRQDMTAYVQGRDYQLAGNSIEWLEGAEASPAAGDRYTIEYLYNPTYVFLGSQKTPRPGQDGLMPQRGALMLYHPSD